MYKKIVISLASISLLFGLVGKSMSNATQEQVAIYAELHCEGQESYAWYVLGVNEVARAKHFESGMIIEGSIDSISSDSCSGAVRIMQREGIPLGGEAGYSKMYKILHQFPLTLKKDTSLKLELNRDVYLTISYRAESGNEISYEMFNGTADQ